MKGCKWLKEEEAQREIFFRKGEKSVKFSYNV